MESWLVSRSYRAVKVRPEILKINLIDRANLLIKKPKHQENSITLVLTFHPALNIEVNVLKPAHRFIEKSPELKVVLPKPPRVAFRNPKTLRNKLVRSKFKQNDEDKRERSDKVMKRKDKIFLVDLVTMKYVRYYSLEKNSTVQLLVRFLR